MIKPQFICLKTLFLMMLVFSTSGQSSIELIRLQCPDEIIKDSVDFVSKNWIQKELNKDSLIYEAEEIIIKHWSYPEGDLPQDSLTPLILKWIDNEREATLNRIRKLQGILTDDDRVFYYRNSDSDWNSLTGIAGIVVLRDCELIANVIIAQS